MIDRADAVALLQMNRDVLDVDYLDHWARPSWGSFGA